MAILTRSIKLSALASMSDEEKVRCVGEIVQAAANPSAEQLNQQLDELEHKIQFFESRYKMTSEEMKRRLATGEISESADFCSWLMLLKIRGQCENDRESSRRESF